MNKNSCRVGIYMRLSREDDGISESSSISTQRKLLLDYALQNNYNIVDEYVDDGYSGTNFNRPSFQRMINDIENKKINYVIVKDLSRLGRDYILTGQYTEIYFPSKNVRFIAINDGYDSINQYSDIAPFKNVINEMYARDISKKIRSALATKMKEGSFIGAFAPYGYKRSDENKNKLVIDKDVEYVIKKIFANAKNGMAPTEIAKDLNESKIMSPAVYRCYKMPHLNIYDYSKNMVWTSSTILKIIHNEVYIGNLVQGKTTTISFKNKKTINNKDNLYVAENTHKPIINKNTFEIANRMSKLRLCKKKNEFYNIFSGIAVCMDCGKNMSTTKTSKNSGYNLTCGKYKLYGKNKCTNHFILYNHLCEIVENILQDDFIKIKDEKNKIINIIEKSNNFCNNISVSKNKLEKKLEQLDCIIKRIYEDRNLGIISEDRFLKLLDQYEKEILNIKTQLLDKNNNSNYNKKMYEDKFDKFIENCKLTPKLLFNFIDHIKISQGEYVVVNEKKVKKQKIEIYLRFKGQNIKKQYVYKNTEKYQA